MIKLTDKEIREVFHFLFLERLLRISDPKLYILKGGVNLRFFLGSPRYSEDMDLDVIGGSVETLKKNGYKIINDPSFRRILATYGISDVLINDPEKAKHTATTQRFKARLMNASGEIYPTKVEFSRRNKNSKTDAYSRELINPEIARKYNRTSFACQHYSFDSAARQKIEALAGRNETQARDPFDLFLIYSSGRLNPNFIHGLPPDTANKAKENLLSISFKNYRDQVAEFLEFESREIYGNEEHWNLITETLLKLLDVNES